jgi:hypothetical protein
VEQHKATKPSIKVSTLGIQKRAQAGPGKVSGPVLDSSNTSQNHVPSQKSRAAFSGDRPKSTPKATSQMSDPTVPMCAPSEYDSFPVEMYLFLLHFLIHFIEIFSCIIADWKLVWMIEAAFWSILRL